MRGRTLLFLVLAVSCRHQPAPTMAPQQASPMRETARAHERLVAGNDSGLHLRIEGVFASPVDLFVPQRVVGLAESPLVIHFLGPSWLPARAVATMPESVMIAAVHLGSGSAANGRPFVEDSARFTRLQRAIEARLAAIPAAPRIGDLYLSAWSAGYGAIRQILRSSRSAQHIRGILLLDGLHASYRPEGTPLAAGGAIDSLDLAPFLAFARRAASGEARMVVTHSEVFPGTYASTTESADWLLTRLGLSRTPVLEWGPVGMQLVSRARAGALDVLGFAGNSAPDHVDHLHGMSHFLALVLRP